MQCQKSIRVGKCVNATDNKYADIGYQISFVLCALANMHFITFIMLSASYFFYSTAFVNVANEF